MGWFPELYTKVGTYRAYHLAAIVFISSFLAGYGSGIFGGILTYPKFQDDFGFTAATKTQVSSLTVGLEQLGSFISCFFVYAITSRWGRKWTMIGSTVLYIVGVIIQVCPTHSLPAWYVGRIIAGLGMGGLSIVVPMYSAEMTPAEIRGRCGSFYQWMYTWGVLLAYWVDYGVANSPSIAATSKVWQIPVGLELVSAGIMVAGLFTLPESTRWLLTKGRRDEAWEALVWIRGTDNEQTQAEFTETQTGLVAEAVARKDFSLKEILEPQNRLRFFIGPTLFLFQNATGSSALAVFGPQYFALLVGTSGNRDLLLTGLFGAVKVIACTFFIWVLSERFGRRWLLVGGSLSMATCMLITAVIVDKIPTTSTTNVTDAGRATVAMIYLNIMIYNCSWGPIPWAYVPEIFPTRIRAEGLAFSMLMHWATSVCFSTASPYLIKALKANTFLLFMGFDILASIFCFIFVKETRGKALEVANGTEWEVAEKATSSEKTGLSEEDLEKPQFLTIRDTFSTNLKSKRNDAKNSNTVGVVTTGLKVDEV